jgi:hypothetical protein
MVLQRYNQCLGRRNLWQKIQHNSYDLQFLQPRGGVSDEIVEIRPTNS